MADWSSELYRKYNIPAPRYTSYPTVPYWERTPSEDEWVSHLQASLTASRQGSKGAAIYIHVPFCESLCSFCGCNTRITKNHAVGLPYTQIVTSEWKLYQEKVALGGDWLVSEIHLGGGTPTFLSSAELAAMLEPILSDVDVADGAEFSVEIDPRVTSKEQLQTLYGLGFRRLSLGIQGFDPVMQELVNRVQPYGIVENCATAAREVGYESINFDLIYGLPKQSVTGIEDTFEKVVKLRPDRIAFYSYAHVPWIKPMHRKFTEADLPNAKAKRQLYETGRKRLEEAGYSEIGMDHFALASDSLARAASEGSLHRNFMGYIPRQVEPLVGLGVSAIGDAGASFAQNEKILERYRARVESGALPILRGHVLSEEDKIVRGHILDIMTKFETTAGPSSASQSLLETARSRLGELERDGLVELEGSKVHVTEVGRPFLRNVTMAFDARLNRRMPDADLFSSSV